MAKFLLLLALLYALASRSISDNAAETEQTGTDTDKTSGGVSKTSPFTELLGETLYRWKINADDTMEVEELSTVELLKGKTAIAIYFSASWCGPCKQFTPVLAQLYKNLNKKGKKFEVVWLSRDRSSEEFLGYYQKMPWLAVTLQNVQPILEKIAPMYQLKGIPHLVILDGDDASLITLNGVSLVMKDKYGLEYPWRSRSLINLIPKPLKRLLKNQTNQAMRVLEGMLEGLAPKKVLVWMQLQAMSLLSIAKDKAMAYVKAQIERKAPSPASQAATVGDSEKISPKKTAQEQQIEVAVVEDYGLYVEVSEDENMLLSA